jgi:nucleotide-binding universal stress UspA family protein
MYNNIMVPLDGSKLGEAVIPFVNEIIAGAKENRKINVTLLQVIPGQKEVVTSTQWPNLVHAPYSEAELEQIKKPVIEYLDRIGATLKKDSMVAIKSLVKVGDDPADEILKASDELMIDLIAISTHGRSGITRWAYGSVADRILRGGNTPVFMVRAAKQAR